MTRVWRQFGGRLCNGVRCPDDRSAPGVWKKRGLSSAEQDEPEDLSLNSRCQGHTAGEGRPLPALLGNAQDQLAAPGWKRNAGPGEPIDLIPEGLVETLSGATQEP